MFALLVEDDANAVTAFGEDQLMIGENISVGTFIPGDVQTIWLSLGCDCNEIERELVRVDPKLDIYDILGSDSRR